MENPTGTSFRRFQASVKTSLPERFDTIESVEKFHCSFKAPSESVNLLWLENPEESWFEVDLYKDGRLQTSETFDSKDEVLSFVETIDSQLE